MTQRVENPARGEAALLVGRERIVLRPSFEALVAAEAELGSLFALVERAAEGRLLLSEVAVLFACCAPGAGPFDNAQDRRDRIGAAVAEMGLARVAPVLKGLLRQILDGRG
jgi:hypothetical protein